MSTKCSLCNEIPKSWKGDDRKCAFPDGSDFSSDNWNCATMNALRDSLADDVWARDGVHAGVIAAPDSADETHVVISMYKNRGNVQNAFALDGDGKFLPLRAELAEAMARKIYEKTRGAA